MYIDICEKRRGANRGERETKNEKFHLIMQVATFVVASGILAYTDRMADE